MKKFIFSIGLLCSLVAILMVSAPNAYAEKKTKKQVQKAAEPKKPANTISKSPYIGAIAVDAATGKVLFEDNADGKGWPASITKLMDLLVFLEAIESKRLSLQDQVTVTAEASRIGGSQVYLKENEVFTVDELLYALVVQSANDAAVALALHFAGSKEAFVELMNKRAQELGMKETVFHSVHGLPPGKDQSPDVSTPREMTILCRALLKYPDTLRYTATREHTFRPSAKEPFIMRSHNHLLGNMEGCDGLKTGYFTAAGFSIAATAIKKNQRAIAVVFGSEDRKTRDAKARDILSKGLMTLVASAPPSAPVMVQAQAPQEKAEKGEEAKAETKPSEVIEIKKSTLVTGAVVVFCFIAGFILLRSVSRRNRD